MEKQASKLALVFKKAAKDGVLEKQFRVAVGAQLMELAKAAGIELFPHTEITLSTCRADTICNRFIVERAKHGSNSGSLTHAPKEHEHFPQVSPGGTKTCVSVDEGQGTGRCMESLLQEPGPTISDALPGIV